MCGCQSNGLECLGRDCGDAVDVCGVTQHCGDCLRPLQCQGSGTCDCAPGHDVPVARLSTAENSGLRCYSSAAGQCAAYLYVENPVSFRVYASNPGGMEVLNACVTSTTITLPMGGSFTIDSVAPVVGTCPPPSTFMHTIGYISPVQVCGAVPLFLLSTGIVSLATTSIAERDMLLSMSWVDSGTVGYVWPGN